MNKNALIAVGIIVVVVVAALAVTQFGLFAEDKVGSLEEAAQATEDVSSIATDIAGDLEDIEGSLG